MRSRKPRLPCPACGDPVENLRSRFCSNTCQMEMAYRNYILRWKAGQETGSRGQNGVVVSGYVRRFLVEKHGERCQKCGWDKRNPVTGRVPVTVSHVDGDWRRTV